MGSPRYRGRMTDWVQIYSDGVDAVAELAGRLTDDQLTTAVPATPAWTVHGVLAHLAGTAADVTTRQTEGAPGEAWTQRQVDERREASIAELVGELRGTLPSMAGAIGASDPPALVWNLVVHLADVTEALGLPRPDASLWQPILQALHDLVPESLRGADDYEVFRALFTRRSRRQVAALAGGDAAGLDRIGLFGGRDDDQPGAVAV